MTTTKAENRFFESTRGRIVTLLRRGPHTVEDLASHLGLTDNAIRMHLIALERDELVTQGEKRRGAGKPSFTYTLTPEAERLFPKAYGLLIQQLLQVLGERLPREALVEALRETGHRLAENHIQPDRELHDRLESAVSLLGDLGGLAVAGLTTGGYVIHGFSCPFATAVEGDPDTCLLAETLLSDLIGASVRQACDHGTPPRCRFEVLTDESRHGASASSQEGQPM